MSDKDIYVKDIEQLCDTLGNDKEKLMEIIERCESQEKQIEALTNIVISICFTASFNKNHNILVDPLRKISKHQMFGAHMGISQKNKVKSLIRQIKGANDNAKSLPFDKILDIIDAEPEKK